MKTSKIRDRGDDPEKNDNMSPKNNPDIVSISKEL